MRRIGKSTFIDYNDYVIEKHLNQENVQSINNIHEEKYRQLVKKK